MTYREAVARILALRGGEIAGMQPGLERIETLLAAIGNPERAFRIVQVGGTNGKGSVSAMLASILRASGVIGTLSRPISAVFGMRPVATRTSVPKILCSPETVRTTRATSFPDRPCTRTISAPTRN